MVEDDKNFGAVLKSYLEIHDFQVEWVEDGSMAVDVFKKQEHQLCILDVMLPNVDGFTIGRQIRELAPDIPMIFLTAKTLKKDILEGFRIGADDYITKPFDSEVLLCKIKAILKRNLGKLNGERKNEFRIGAYLFNYEHRTIRLGSSIQRISPKESELLLLLCRQVNSVLPREDALKSIWGDDNYFTTRSMDVFITKLRKYLKDDPAVEIINIHGSGYKLSVIRNQSE